MADIGVQGGYHKVFLCIVSVRAARQDVLRGLCEFILNCGGCGVTI